MKSIFYERRKEDEWLILEIKQCSICKEIKPISDFYSQNKNSKKLGNWVYYHPECKICSKNRSSKWIEDNPRKYKKYRKKYDDNPSRKEPQLFFSKRRVREGKFLEWQRTDSGKKSSKKSQDNRMEKQHNITIREWDSCRLYFDYRCAYCGMTYEEHIRIHKQDLHKEHIIHDGRNDLKNCIPSCKVCNSSKLEKSFNNWYNVNNEKYDRVRYFKIYKWLRFDVQNYIEQKRRY